MRRWQSQYPLQLTQPYSCDTLLGALHIAPIAPVLTYTEVILPARAILEGTGQAGLAPAGHTVRLPCAKDIAQSTRSWLAAICLNGRLESQKRTDILRTHDEIDYQVHSNRLESCRWSKAS